MEVYSTLLWHLQRNVELSFLAQELLSIDPRSSQAWIAVGNLFHLLLDFCKCPFTVGGNAKMVANFLLMQDEVQKDGGRSLDLANYPCIFMVIC